MIVNTVASKYINTKKKQNIVVDKTFNILANKVINTNKK